MLKIVSVTFLASLVSTKPTLLLNNLEKYPNICSVLSSVLTTPVWSESDFEIIQGPQSSCTVKLVGSNDKVNFCVNSFLTLIPKIITNESLTPPSVSDFNHLESNWPQNLSIPRFKIYKHSPHCDKALIFVHNPSLPLYPSFKYFQLRSLLHFPFNTNPQLVHHVFIGEEAWIQEIFQKDDVKILKYKTGITIENRINPTQRILQEKGFPPKLTAFKEDQYLKERQGRFDILRKRHFMVNSFSLKTHVVRDEHGKPIGGAGYNFIKTLTEYYNSTFDFSHEGEKNSRQMPNGSWNGFIGALGDSKVDIAVWFGNTETRNPYCDITTPAVNLPVVFFTSLPRASVKWYGIAFVFSSEVWLCIALSIVSVIPVYYYKFWVENDSDTGTKLYLSIMLPVGALLQEARNIPTKARGLSGLYLFYGIIIGIFFNSNLISFLTLPELEHAPETPDELWKMKEYDIRYLSFPGAACDLFFSHTKSPMYLDIKKRMKYLPLSSTIQSMMETALGPKTAQLQYDLFGLVNVAQNLTFHPGFVPLKMSRSPIFDLPVGFALRKYSKFTETVSHNVGKLQNTGHFKKWFDQTLDIVRGRGIKWLRKVKAEERREELGYRIVELAEEAMSSRTKPFTLVQFGLSFCCLVFGLSFGFVCFLVESYSPCLKDKSRPGCGGSVIFVKRTPACTKEDIWEILVCGVFRSVVPSSSP
ncbi:unnamed protein product [Allacma fusca]|uniref:Uncharacterized protein n=1 Tax=Allacma fusca TaxID=39272 RepID=A0A8J2NL11_9HEXA|nr:unnamed protein product [Allacma fusca]